MEIITNNKVGAEVTLYQESSWRDRKVTTGTIIGETKTLYKVELANGDVKRYHKKDRYNSFYEYGNKNYYKQYIRFEQI